MEIVLDILKEYEILILLGLIVLILIMIFIQILNKIELNRMDKRYKKLMKGSSSKTIEEMVIEYSNKVQDSLEIVENVQDMYKDVDARLKRSLQKFAVVRYRAFDDVGSDLSFSIAFLDEKNDGIILTGIYGRNECTTFAKPIEKGISKYDLSEEEKTALKNAINGRE